MCDDIDCWWMLAAIATFHAIQSELKNLSGPVTEQVHARTGDNSPASGSGWSAKGA